MFVYVKNRHAINSLVEAFSLDNVFSHIFVCFCILQKRYIFDEKISEKASAAFASKDLSVWT